MTKFLAAVFAFFVLVLVVCYYITKQTNPIFVDVQGNPTNATAHARY